MHPEFSRAECIVLQEFIMSMLCIEWACPTLTCHTNNRGTFPRLDVEDAAMFDGTCFLQQFEVPICRWCDISCCIRRSFRYEDRVGFDQYIGKRPMSVRIISSSGAGAR